MAKQYRNNTEVLRRPALGDFKKQHMVAVLIRNLSAFKAAAGRLRQEHFGAADRGLAAVWQLTMMFHKDFDYLPDFSQLKGMLEEYKNANPSLFSNIEWDQVCDTVTFAFNKAAHERPISTDKRFAAWAIHHLKLMLEENLLAAMQAMSQSRNMIPTNLPDLMAGMMQASQEIGTLSSQDEDYYMAFPDGWNQKDNVMVHSTGVDFLDRFMGGGHANGEVYGLMAPFGSCKTLLACQLASNAAKYYAAALAADPSQKPMMSFIFGYETSRGEMERRSLSFLAEIARDTMDTLKDDVADLKDAGFSTAATMKPYERDRFRKDIAAGKARGEYDRAQEAIKVFRQHIWFGDMSGNEHGMGNGGINEIVQLIQTICDKRNVRCGLVLVDYVGAMAKAELSARQLDQSMLRHLIDGAQLEAKRKIARAFDCPVWMLHQLNGEANKANPISIMDHTSGSETSKFAENLDFCFNISKPQEKDQFALIGCTKHRRQPPMPYSILRIDGLLSRVENMDKHCHVDKAMRQIMLKSEAAALPGGLDAEVKQAARASSWVL